VLCIIYYKYVLTQYSAGTIYRRVEKNHGLQLEDPKSVPFNVDVVFAADGGTLHERYVKISIVFH
jgi:hypothetical protein